MSRPHITPTGRAATFNEEEIIVSKTDLRGVITYTNDVFRRVSGYTMFFYDGHLVEYGSTTQIFEAPREERTGAYVHGRMG